jgi:hypothetical protein
MAGVLVPGQAVASRSCVCEETKSEVAAAARIGAGLAAWKRAELLGLMRPRFARVESWLQAGKYAALQASLWFPVRALADMGYVHQAEIHRVDDARLKSRPMLVCAEVGSVVVNGV